MSDKGPCILFFTMGGLSLVISFIYSYFKPGNMGILGVFFFGILCLGLGVVTSDTEPTDFI